MNAGPVRPDDVDDDRQRAAAENRRLAAQEKKEALYHAEMAVCLSAVGDKNRARSERSQATVLRRAAQIKRDLATKCDPHGDAARRGEPAFTESEDGANEDAAERYRAALATRRFDDPVEASHPLASSADETPAVRMRRRNPQV